MSVAGPLVLLIEDEPQMRRFLRVTLDGNGYRLVESPTAREGLTLAASHNPDVILLDLGLPDGDGIDLARRLREWSGTPIIVISARGREGDKVAALDAGADDYLTKPFGTGELLARMRVALRHAAAKGDGEAPTVEFGALKVDFARRLVWRGGLEVRLTPLEYKLFSELVRHEGRVLTHRHLLAAVWGSHAGVPAHNLRVLMGQLRHKLEDVPARPRHLTTEAGVGYRLRE